ncbi:hypothetical protein OK016_14470 [Vibrio chagasii]|nr:hypothetical protein [Vibrio chagasii]
MTGILQPNNPPYAVLIEALETIEVDELSSFVQSILASFMSKCLCMATGGKRHTQDG